MADSVYIPGLAIPKTRATEAPRHAWLVRVTHWVNALSFVGLVVSGIGILVAHPRFYWGETGGVGTPSILDLPLPFMLGGPSGWGRYLHFQSAWLCVLTGMIYVAWGVARRHFRNNLAPERKDRSWESLRRSIASHLRFERSGQAEAWSYNVLQRITYLGVIFVLFPLMIATGLAMSPAVTSVFPAVVNILGGHQCARTLHFAGSIAAVLFVVVHLAMVWRAGFRRRVGAMITSYGVSGRVGPAGSLSRRRLVTAGLTTTGGVAGLAVAAKIADRYGLIPPDWAGVYGPGETLTYASQRILTSGHSLAREFGRSQISKVAQVSGDPPRRDAYRRLLAREFAEWRLSIDGLVARPGSFSLADLKRLPSRSQITEHTCEEGWSYVAEWTGVPLSDVMNLVGVLPQARYVVSFPFDESWDSLDMPDAWHPQTLIAYQMNGAALSAEHGAPARLKVPRQLGYKSVKYLSRITVTDTLKNIGSGLGSSSPDAGYSWYAGI